MSTAFSPMIEYYSPPESWVVMDSDDLSRSFGAMKSQMTTETRKELFDLFVSSRGTIMPDEAELLLRALGYLPTLNFASKKDCGAEISWSSFCNICENSKLAPSDEDLIRALESIPKAFGNSVGIEELKNLVLFHGDPLSNDEVEGLLNRVNWKDGRLSVGELCKALRLSEYNRRSSIFENISSFVSRMAVLHEKSGKSSSEHVGALMFLDISGFTKATTILKAKGAVGVSEAVNGYLSKLITCIDDHGGDILKFAGDALIVFWEAGGTQSMQNAAKNAATCALSLQFSYALHHIDGDLSFRIHIGIHCGSIVSRFAKSENALFHYITGPAIRSIGRIVDGATAGEVCCSSNVWDLISSNANGRAREGMWLIEKLHNEDSQFSARSTSNDVAEKLLPRVVCEYLASSTDPGTIAELRFLVVLFVSLPTQSTDDVDALCSTIRNSGADVVQVMDDDKGFHLISCFNISIFMELAADAAVQLAADIIAMKSSAFVGISCGETFFGVIGNRVRRTIDILGDGVNMACRMMQHGMAVKVNAVFTADVYDACTNRTKLISLEQTLVKGRTKPLMTYTLHPSCINLDPSTIDFSVAPIYGDIAVKLDQWARHIADIACPCKILEGRFGSGKWTLALHSMYSIKDDLLLPIVLTAKSAASHGDIVPALLSLLATMLTESVITSRVVPAKFNPSLVENLECREKFYSLYEGRFNMQPSEIIERIEVLFGLVETPGHSCIAIRHIQFLDSVSAEVLDFVLNEYPILMLGTYEKERGFRPISSILSEWQGYETVTVDGFSEAEADLFIRVIVQDVWNVKRVACNPAFIQTIVRLASRHPCSIKELVRSIQKQFSLKVHSDETIGISRSDFEELSSTPWTIISPLVANKYISTFDRLDVMQRLLLKVMATISTVSGVRIIPMRVVYCILRGLTSIQETSNAVEKAISELSEYGIVFTVTGLSTGITFQQLVFRDTVWKLILPSYAKTISERSAAAFESLPSHNLNMVVASSLHLHAENFQKAYSLLHRAVHFDKESSDPSLLPLFERIECLLEQLRDKLDVSCLADLIDQKKLSLAESLSSQRRSTGVAVKVPFEISQLPLVSDAVYDRALTQLCIEVNGIAVYYNTGVQLEQLMSVVGIAHQYLEEFKRIASRVGFQDTEAIKEIEAITDQLALSGAEELSIPLLLEFEKKLRAFLKTGATQLKATVEAEAQVKLQERIVWNDSLSNGWMPMDEQHQYLVDQLSNLQRLYLEAKERNEQLDPAAIGVILSKLQDYVVFHFGMEEAVMEQFDYPRTASHKAIHRHFTSKVSSVVSQVLAGDMSVVSKDLISFLFSWLNVHITAEDRILANWVRDIEIEQGIEVSQLVSKRSRASSSPGSSQRAAAS